MNGEERKLGLPPQPASLQSAGAGLAPRAREGLYRLGPRPALLSRPLGTRAPIFLPKRVPQQQSGACAQSSAWRRWAVGVRPRAGRTLLPQLEMPCTRVCQLGPALRAVTGTTVLPMSPQPAPCPLPRVTTVIVPSAGGQERPCPPAPSGLPDCAALKPAVCGSRGARCGRVPETPRRAAGAPCRLRDAA